MSKLNRELLEDIEREEDAAETNKWQTIGLIWRGLCPFLFGGCAAAVIYLTPKVFQTYTDFGVELPSSTKALQSIPSQTLAIPYVVGLFACFIIHYLVRPMKKAILIQILIASFIILITATYLIILYLPSPSLVQGVGN